MSDISVLMATHAGELATHLRESLESLATQTRLPDECVLVVNGPIDDGQEAVLRHFTENAPFPLRIVRLPTNGGLAHALNAGLPYCRGRFIARMDSDDICLPQRLQIQAEAFDHDPQIDVLAAWSLEFDRTRDRVIAVKRTPANHAAIIRALRWRNVIVHPTLVVRAEWLRRVGGYSTAFPYLEDYDLFVRLAQAGAHFAAIQQPLLLFRTSVQQRHRRRAVPWRREVAFRRACWNSGFVPLGVSAASAAIHIGFRLAPESIKKALYRLVRHPADQT